jgi:hypothetical protein
MVINNRLGIQQASKGSISPACAMVRLTIWKTMYTKASAKPRAILTPEPSLDFRADKMTPIRVRITMEKGYVNLRYFSTL